MFTYGRGAFPIDVVPQSRDGTAYAVCIEFCYPPPSFTSPFSHINYFSSLTRASPHFYAATDSAVRIRCHASFIATWVWPILPNSRLHLPMYEILHSKPETSLFSIYFHCTIRLFRSRTNPSEELIIYIHGPSLPKAYTLQPGPGSQSSVATHLLLVAPALRGRHINHINTTLLSITLITPA